MNWRRQIVWPFLMAPVGMTLLNIGCSSKPAPQTGVTAESRQLQQVEAGLVTVQNNTALTPQRKQDIISRLTERANQLRAAGATPPAGAPLN